MSGKSIESYANAMTALSIRRRQVGDFRTRSGSLLILIVLAMLVPNILAYYNRDIPSGSATCPSFGEDFEISTVSYNLAT